MGVRRRWRRQIPRWQRLKRRWDCPPFIVRRRALIADMDYVADVLYNRVGEECSVFRSLIWLLEGFHK